MDSTHFDKPNSGIVPESGVFSVRRWAEFFETSEETFCRWVSQYEIPFFKPGNKMFLDAADVRRRIPYHNRENGDE